MKVSVVVPVYNTERYLQRCLDSILSQTFKDFELYIVDDCSTDSSWDIIQSIEDDRVIKKRNPKNKQIKTSWADLPLHDGDIIYMKDCKKEPKSRKTDNGWEDIPGEYEWWLNDYSICNL